MTAVPQAPMGLADMAQREVHTLSGDSRHIAGPAAEVIDAATLSDLYGHPLRRVENFFVPE
jgi:hypothetical protein